MTLAVTPEEFGPVTVRAVIGPDGVKMELFASTDAGRDALRSAMTDLRRDLAGQGMNATLDLSSRGQPDQQASGRDNPSSREQQAGREPSRAPANPLAEQATTPDRRMYTSGPTLDVTA